MANEFVLASPVSSYLQGRQASQQNQLGQLQLQSGQRQLMQAQGQAERDEQFRNELATYLQGGSDNLAALYAADPERAMQVQAFQSQRQQAERQQKVEAAKQVYASASAVIESAAPAARARVLHPDAIAQWAQANGKDPEEMTDEEAVEIATQVREQAGAVAGILPKYTNPEAAQVDGRDVFFQTDETTGRTRVVPGVSPRPQKPQVQIDLGQKFEGSAEKAFGEAEGQAFQTVLQRGQDAQDKAASLRAMKENPAITGPTRDLRASANAFFGDLGIPLSEERVKQISNLAQYKAIQNNLVLGEQLKQKGPQTESDAKRIAESFGKTNNIQEANKLILNYQLALADREGVLAQLAEEYRQREGKIDGWRKEYREYVRKTPLAGIDPQSKRLVFWNEFIEGMKEHNPQMNDEEIMGYWRKRYGGAK